MRVWFMYVHLVSWFRHTTNTRKLLPIQNKRNTTTTYHLYVCQIVLCIAIIVINIKTIIDSLINFYIVTIYFKTISMLYEYKVILIHKSFNFSSCFTNSQYFKYMIHSVSFFVIIKKNSTNIIHGILV